MGTEPISDFFDREVCCRARRRSLPGSSPGAEVSGVSRTLLDLLEGAGLPGRSVLELGSGTGALRGHAPARGELGDRRRPLPPERGGGQGAPGPGGARRAGVVPRGRRRGHRPAPARCGGAGQGVLLLPDAERLLDASLRAAGSLYAVALPASEGVRGTLSRVGVWFENLWRWVTRDRFRAFVHDVPPIDSRLRTAGFVPLRTARRWMWHAAVYRREPSIPGAAGRKMPR